MQLDEIPTLLPGLNSRDDAGPSSIKESPPDDLISNTSRELSTSLEGHASSSSSGGTESFLSAETSISSTPTSTSTHSMDSSSKNEEGNSFIYIQPGSAEHEAMKESVIDIVRRRLEEWEALGLINGVRNKRNEELGEALNLDLVQTYEEIEKRIKEFIHLDWPQFEKG
ncbi:hypothetical protein ACH5RR_039300 [Cinchona calisaya]|uniref:Uncharacterized protein n=1 Tax=Cinchona calisaya TaxID=153742 RepID=A0ABD2Y2Z9_9GENT